jgi:hypothetical protein
MWDWSNVALAIAALVGLTAGVIQLGFDMLCMVDHGSVMKPGVRQADELMAHSYKKAA